MKYHILFICVVLCACSSKQVDQTSTADLPQPPPMQSNPNQRQIASDEAYLGNSYNSYFADENYLARLEKMRKLVRQLHVLMEEKGHPRKKILKKFQNDLDRQISFLDKLEIDKSKLIKGWLPKENTYQYSAKIRALGMIQDSGNVMAQLETYLSSTKVLDEDNFEQNFYYSLLRKALRALSEDLQKRESPSSAGIFKAQLSYADYISSNARRDLRKVFSDRKDRATEKRVNAFFRRLQQVRSEPEAKSLLASSEMNFAHLALQNADYTQSSDIEGARDDMDTKITTYFGLEMIKYLYGQLN